MPIVLADKRGQSDGSVIDLAQKVNTSIPILIITRPEGYEFNEEILSLKGKPYIIFDFIEYGWNASFDHTHFFGFGRYSFHGMSVFPQFNDNKDEWEKLNDFIESHQPVRYFKREMLAKDQDDFYVPINYPCVQPIPDPETKEHFYKRPLDVFYSWGYSHPERRRLHGEIWVESNKRNYVVCDNLYFLEKFIKRETNPHKWVTANIPDYCRFPTKQIVALNGLSRISISMPGAGTCCFRHTESPINSAMLMKEDNMAWSYEWVNGENCIKFYEFGGEIETIQSSLAIPQLYDIYRNGIETCKKYHIDTYISDYILPLINNA